MSLYSIMMFSNKHAFSHVLCIYFCWTSLCLHATHYMSAHVTNSHPQSVVVIICCYCCDYILLINVWSYIFKVTDKYWEIGTEYDEPTMWSVPCHFRSLYTSDSGFKTMKKVHEVEGFVTVVLSWLRKCPYKNRNTFHHFWWRHLMGTRNKENCRLNLKA